MKKIKVAQYFIMLFVIFYFVYNIYFGFDKYPESDLEKTFDDIFIYGIFFSWILFFLPLIDVYIIFIKTYTEKNTIKNHDRCTLNKKCTPLNLSGTCSKRCKYFKIK